MSDYLVIGNMFPEELEEEVIENSRGYISSASNAHLSMIIDGLDKNLGEPVDIVNVLPVPSYPKRYKKLFVKGFSFSHSNGANDYNVPYTNLTVWKKLSVQWNLNKTIRGYTDKKYIIVYNAEVPLLKAALKLKKKSADARVCVIAPDLPAYTDLDKQGKILYKLWNKIKSRKADKLVKKCDRFVFLTEAMAEYYGVKNSYIVSEGMAKVSEAEKTNKRQCDFKYVTYTGTFNRVFGIGDVLDAVRNISGDDYRFIFCGSGEMAEEIKNFDDPRVIYKGVVTGDELREIQKNATVLINPRSDEVSGEDIKDYTKYSFPSKIMEYMNAGRPVVCFKLPGIPDEYDDYLIYFKDRASIAEEIERICSKDSEELDNIGRKNREFVSKYKNNIAQTKNIIDLLMRKDLLFCMEPLKIGGTTTSLIALLNELDPLKYNIDLICENNTGELMDRVPDYVNVLKGAVYNGNWILTKMYKLIGYTVKGYMLKKALYKGDYGLGKSFQLMYGQAGVSIAREVKKHYDAAVGYMEGFPDYYVVKKTNAKSKIVYFHIEHTNGEIDPELDREMIAEADKVVLITDTVKAAFDSVFPEYADKSFVVENIVSKRLADKLSYKAIDDFLVEDGVTNIVTAARLDNMYKRLDRAVAAARYLKEQHCKFMWYIFGDGPDKDMLENLIKENSVSDCMKLMGSRSNVLPYIKQCDLFVLTSSFEGKPMAVTEAMMLGVVPVVTNYASAKMQVKDYGIVCENNDTAIGEALKELIREPEKIEKYKEKLKGFKEIGSTKAFESVVFG